MTKDEQRDHLGDLSEIDYNHRVEMAKKIQPADERERKITKQTRNDAPEDN